MEAVDIIAGFLAIPAVIKVLDLYRFLVEGAVQWRSALYTVGSWVLGTGLIALVGQSAQGESLGLAGLSLATLILYGIEIGSAGSVIHDFRPAANQLYIGE